MKPKFLILFSLLILLILNILFSISIGPVRIPFDSVISTIFYYFMGDPYNRIYMLIIFYIRMPRVFLAVLIGAVLAISGLITQTIFRNPLGDPYLTGIASGAALGASIGFLISPFVVEPLAFAFAMLAVFITFIISRVDGEFSPEIMILAGIAVSFLFSALASYLIYLKEVNLRGVLFWLLGGLYGANWNDVFYLTIACLILFPLILYFVPEFDLMLMGDEQAKSMGVNTKRVKLITLLSSSIITSFAVSMVGIIGFIGLVSPHIGRKIIGESHRFLLPASILIGANLLLASDTIARSNPGGEIPVGIITSFVGAPLLIYLLIRRRFFDRGN
jgi:iron complex transport system permease protein